MKSCALILIMAGLTNYIVNGQARTSIPQSKTSPDSAVFDGLTFRSIGPALTSGRIADFAINPEKPYEYFVAVASGGIWKTVNAGITYEPVFDSYGSYAIGCLAMDPSNPSVVWAGTGENNSQRALGYGDGVYKTEDGGKSWTNMGLKTSRQIGKILIHPENTDIVYVAAEGSVWGPGGERGLFMTTDGGKTWQAVLTISENTGISDIAMDPRYPEILYAAAHQRRRHVYTKINGGPESAIYKTSDGGKTWKKLESGLPSVHLGAIGLAISPVNPDVVYAIIEAAYDKSGFFRSTDRGESWEKMSSYCSSGPQYYNEIFCDPVDVDKVYSVDTYTQYTEDAGRTFKRLGLEYRHVDDHALWIDPDHTGHLLIGGDGGIYESYDAGKNWEFKTNLPVTQFYRVNVDNSKPFYYIYGGTQDNNTLGGPSQNTSAEGVSSAEWFVTLGGDGFWTAIDPENPDIIYSEYQYGNVYRYDRKSGESLKIKPQERKGELTYRWNWDAPMILSPHSATRLYMGANKLFRSDDRGNSWKVISGDLTRNMDRNTWQVMGKYWSAEAVAKDVSTSQYGTIVALAESPVKEDLLFAGTDDGLLQITEDAGKTWVSVRTFPDIPEYTYVSDILPSALDANVVYVSFNNHKRDDFKPYILKSTDRGKTWVSISYGLPQNGVVHTLQQDFVRAGLLFAGTEFGIFFSPDDGKNWIRLKSGLPTIPVRDIAIHNVENDLVLATFGRGFYILDDYSPLRLFTGEIQKKEAHIFPIADALMYVPEASRSRQGAGNYAAKNPDPGAVITYYLKEEIKTQKDTRREIEKKQFEKGEKIKVLDWDAIRAENKEELPYLIFTITDEAGYVIRKLAAEPRKGINRITWDLKYPSFYPIRLKEDKFSFAAENQGSLLVLPGTYYIALSKSIDGEITTLTEKNRLIAKPLHYAELTADQRLEADRFNKKVNECIRILNGSEEFTRELLTRIQYLKQANLGSLSFSPELNKELRKLEMETDSILFRLSGHQARASYEEIPPSPVPLLVRLEEITDASWRSTSGITQNQRNNLAIIDEEFPPLLEKLKNISEKRIPELEKLLDRSGAPWTPGRLPVWEE
jgi:photosystem II stability/assembly factor-like uncharacterized protein